MQGRICINTYGSNAHDHETPYLIHSYNQINLLRESINIYLHFVSYLHIDTTQVVEIFLK